MKRTTLWCFSAAVALSSCGGEVIWVDRACGVDAEGRGGESAPYASIQAAVDAAGTGATIKVRPGVYDNGGATTSEGKTNRVKVVGKVLTIESTGGKAVTHVVGGHDPSGTDGMGLGGARCFYLQNAAGTVLRGFTIRDGSSDRYDVAIDLARDSGGGVMAPTYENGTYSDTNCYVVDCVISNCVGVRAAALRGATAVRCYITGNYGERSGAAGRDASFINCLVTLNRGDTFIYGGPPKVYNCTVVNNLSQMYGADVRNSVVMGNCKSGSSARSDSSLAACRFSHSVANTSGYDAKFDSASDLSSCVVDAPHFQFLAPFLEDFRVLKGSVSETAGDASELASLDLPDGIDPYFDLLGRPIPKSGAIMAGCLQETAEPACGAVLFPEPNVIDVDGRPVYGANNYAFSDCWPTQFHVQARAKGVTHIRNFELNKTLVYPTMDDSIWVLPPRDPASVITGEVSVARGVLTVDQNKPEATDDRDGVDNSVPFKTIHAALQHAAHYWIVQVAPGDYGEGEGTFETAGGKTRVLIDKQIRLIGAGADKTTIRGLAPSSDPAVGCVRCVEFSFPNAAIQGFTLADGNADMENSNVDTYTGRGGGVSASSLSAAQLNTVRVLDCVITNCFAARGAGVYGTTCERTLITDCYGTKSGNRFGRFVSCVFDFHGEQLDGQDGNASYNGTMINCTAVGKNGSEYVFNKQGGNPQTNMLVRTTKEYNFSSDCAGSIVWDVASLSSSVVTNADPRLANVSTRNYRLTAGSPALGIGVVVTDLDICWIDFECRPINFTNGRPAAGAYQWPIAGVHVAIPSKGSVSPAGYCGPELDGSLTIEFSDAADRHISGALVDGKEVLLGRGESSISLSLDPADASSTVEVVPIVSTNWYVNANTDPSGGKVVGSDLNTGFTPWEPKRTLMGMFGSGLVQPGDCVHAAAGFYDEGEDAAYRCRVKVAAGASLVGDEGAEKTFILGEYAGSGSDAAHLGESARRPAYLSENATLSGFTLTRGASGEPPSGTTGDNLTGGGGVLCQDSAVVSDCIISNCYSGVGTCIKGSYVRCTIVENCAIKRASAAQDAKLYNCFVDRNRSGNGALSEMKGMWNTTLGANNTKLDGSRYIGVNSGDKKNPMVNCVLLGWVYGSSTIATNCYLVSDNTPSAGAVLYGCTVFDSAAAIGLDSQGRPLSRNSAVVDRGDNDLLPTVFSDRDIDGGQRIYNSKVDVGCCEYDWRPEFSSALGATVAQASPGVTSAASTVSVPAGEKLVVSWANEYGRRVRSSFKVSVPQDSLLSVMCDGEDFAVFGAGSQTFRFLCREGGEDLEFTCAGDGPAVLSDFIRRSGMVMIVR